LYKFKLIIFSRSGVKFFQLADLRYSCSSS
jgi:hypothetical protein